MDQVGNCSLLIQTESSKIESINFMTQFTFMSWHKFLIQQNVHTIFKKYSIGTMVLQTLGGKNIIKHTSEIVLND